MDAPPPPAPALVALASSGACLSGAREFSVRDHSLAPVTTVPRTSAQTQAQAPATASSAPARLPPLPAAPVTASPSAAASPGVTPAQPAPRTGLFDFLPRNSPPTALLLSLAVNGGGQFYNGEPAKGWWMLAPWALYPLAWVADSYLETGYFRTGMVVVVGLGVKGYSAWDAYFTAAARAARKEGQ